MLSKNVNNKNVLLNWYSSMKKIEKDSYDFRCRKLTFKVKFWHFLSPPHYTNSQNSIISFDYTVNTYRYKAIGAYATSTVVEISFVTINIYSV